jgi:hypothetical protein
MFQTFIHYGLHFSLPLLVALLFYKSQWKKAFLIMIAMMVVDVDHLFANPIFDPGRCSIGFHFLHSYWAIGVYVVCAFIKPLRFFALGLLLHMVADAVDCWMMP